MMARMGWDRPRLVAMSSADCAELGTGPYSDGGTPDEGDPIS